MKYLDYNMLYKEPDNGLEMYVPPDFNSNHYTITGNKLFEFDEAELSDEAFLRINEKYKIQFISKNHKPTISIYCVPYLQLIAFDEDGVFGLSGSNDFYESKVYYLANNKKAFFAAENIGDLFSQLQNDTFDKNEMHLTDDVKLFSSYFEAVKALGNESRDCL